MKYRINRRAAGYLEVRLLVVRGTVLALNPLGQPDAVQQFLKEKLQQGLNRKRQQ